MGNEDIDMNEFISFNEKNPKEDKFFNRDRTLELLELYKVFKRKLGTFEVKSMSKLWELVARDISNRHHITILPSKCENRFKVLERNYKKIKDNNNKTGRGRKIFEFENEMDEIFERKKNVYPTLLLTNDKTKSALPHASLETTVVQLSIPDDEPGYSHSATQSGNREEEQGESEGETAKTQGKRDTPRIPSLKRRITSPAYQKRNDILLELKDDLKKFCEKRDKRLEEKLKIAKKKLEESEKRTQIAREYLEFIKNKGTNPED